MPLMVSWLSTGPWVARARPKSITLSLASPSIIRFSGLMSRRRLDPLAEGDGVGEIAKAVLLVVAVGGPRVDERPHAVAVEAVVLEKLQDLPLRPVAVGRAARFVGLHPGDVRADDERGVEGRAAGGAAAAGRAGAA